MFPICVLIPLLTYSVSNPEFAASFESAQGRNEGVQGGAQFPADELLRGRRKVSTILQVLSSMQYIYFRKTLGSNMGAPNLFPVAGAI